MVYEQLVPVAGVELSDEEQLRDAQLARRDRIVNADGPASCYMIFDCLYREVFVYTRARVCVGAHLPPSPHRTRIVDR
jgi:hypothetical protein